MITNSKLQLQKPQTNSKIASLTGQTTSSTTTTTTNPPQQQQQQKSSLLNKLSYQLKLKFNPNSASSKQITNETENNRPVCSSEPPQAPAPIQQQTTIG